MEDFAKSYNNIMDSLISERYIPVLDVLEKYKDDDNAFLSFTADVIPSSERFSRVNKKGTKIGINPKSTYNTPIGVYCYPIKAYWNNIESNNIDFAGHQPHLYVFKAKRPEKLLVASKYTLRDYVKDFKELEEIFSNTQDLTKITKDISINNSKYFNFDENKPAKLFWTLTREIAYKIKEKGIKSTVPVIWTQILRRFYDGVVDDMNWGFIYEAEPTQAVLWTKAQFDVVDYIDRSDGSSRRLKAWKGEDKTVPIEKILNYVKKLKAPIQDEKMLSIVSKNPQGSYIYAQNVLGWKNIPDEILKGIASDSRYAFRYASEILEFKNIPDVILKSISSSMYYSYWYGKELKGENVPDEILKSISNHPSHSYDYVLNVLEKREVPDIILKGISKDSTFAYRYAKYHLKGENVPDIILKSFSNSPDYAMAYAQNVLNYNNVPDIIINGISNNEKESYEYARSLYIQKQEIAPDIILKTIANNQFYNQQYTAHIYNNATLVLEFAKVFEKPLQIPYIVLEAISRNPSIAFKFIINILIPNGISMNELFNGEKNNHFKPIAMAIVNDEKYSKYIAKKYFNWNNIPKIFRDVLTYKDLNMYKTGVPNTVTFTESFKFTQNYKLLLDSFKPESHDMDRIYELFNQEYMQSTGKSWTKDKFLQRSINWDFWGDENGFIATRPQRSGFVKLVGAAGSDKSKYKGFKELLQKNLPVWGMVDSKLASMLTKLGYRGPNMLEKPIFHKLLKSGKMNSSLGGAGIDKIEGDKITLSYPDIGTVEKYLMGSPTYWSDVKKSMLKMESDNFDSMCVSILEKYTKKKKKKVSKIRSKCQSKAKAKYDVWPSAYSSGYVQRCVKRKGKIN